MNCKIDHHVHSKYSACCNEYYDLADIIKVQIEKGMKYICVSDHIHALYDYGWISEHYQLLKNNPHLGSGRTIFIGAELTMISPDGGVPLSFKDNKEKPHFLIGACHAIPGYKLHMWAIEESGNRMKSYTENKLTELFKMHQQMLIAGCNKRNFDILAHPLEFFIRCKIFDKRLLDLFGDVARACRKNNIAVELNNGSIKRCWNSDEAHSLFNTHCISSNEFYLKMVRIAQNENVLFSPASDAHRRIEIGELGFVEQIISETGIQAEQILYLDQYP